MVRRGLHNRSRANMYIAIVVLMFLSNGCVWWWAKSFPGDESDFLHDLPIMENALCIRLRVPPPQFSPRSIGQQLLLEYEEEKEEQRRQRWENQQQNNDSPITEDDIVRAQRNVVTMVADEKIQSGVFVSGDGGKVLLRQAENSNDVEYMRELGDKLVQNFANFIVSATYDAAPVIVDYGCRIGASLARRHTRSTVLCVFDPHDEAAVSQDLQPNLIRLASSGRFFSGFSPFFTSCNFVSVSTIFFPIAPGRGSLRQKQYGMNELMQLVVQILHGSGAVLAVLPLGNCDLLLRHWLNPLLESFNPFWTSAAATASEGLKVGLKVQCSLLADFVKAPRSERINNMEGRVPFRLFQLTVTYAARLCQKVWDAPLLHWGRIVVCVYNKSRVYYRVIDLTARAKNKLSSARVIHPLQYIPSLNVDSLLAAGLSVYERLRVLSGMISTARYSDPLPHNWMIGNEHITTFGGRVFRIDKVDKRFDVAVSERGNYWDNSTRGYLHLLAHHLCLPVGKDGLPSVFYELDIEGRRACRGCIETCSYLPKGTEPCAWCMLCAAGLAKYVEENETLEGHPRNVAKSKLQQESRVSAMACRVSYKNYHSAHVLWETWRREDGKHVIRL